MPGDSRSLYIGMYVLMFVLVASALVINHLASERLIVSSDPKVAAIGHDLRIASIIIFVYAIVGILLMVFFSSPSSTSLVLLGIVLVISLLGLGFALYIVGRSWWICRDSMVLTSLVLLSLYVLLLVVWAVTVFMSVRGIDLGERRRICTPRRRSSLRRRTLRR